jgi:hypothetical protein
MNDRRGGGRRASRPAGPAEAAASCYLGSKITGMSAVKFSASMDETLLEQARQAADQQGTSLSSWLADAAADRLRIDALRGLVDEWETDHGQLTAEELAAADRALAPRPTRRRRK